MKKEKKIRTKMITIRVNEDEQKKLNSFYKQTAANSLSEYARDVLLKLPVTFHYRNKSADDLGYEIIRLKTEVNAIGNNFNQAVRKLHTLEHIPEIKAWAIVNEVSKTSLFKKIDEVREKAAQIYDRLTEMRDADTHIFNL
jgi:hypothetical protein